MDADFMGGNLILGLGIDKRGKRTCWTDGGQRWGKQSYTDKVARGRDEGLGGQIATHCGGHARIRHDSFWRYHVPGDAAGAERSDRLPGYVARPSWEQSRSHPSS